VTNTKDMKNTHSMHGMGSGGYLGCFCFTRLIIHIIFPFLLSRDTPLRPLDLWRHGGKTRQDTRLLTPSMHLFSDSASCRPLAGFWSSRHSVFYGLPVHAFGMVRKGRSKRHRTTPSFSYPSGEIPSPGCDCQFFIPALEKPSVA